MAPSWQHAVALLWACLLSAAGAANVSQGGQLKMGLAWTWYADYEYLVGAVMADLDFKKNFNESIRARFGPPILPIDNIHPLNRPQMITREVLGSEVFASKAAKDLVDRDVNVLIGDFLTGPSEVMGTFAGSLDIPHLTLSIGDTLGERKRYPYTFRTAAPGSHIYLFYWKYMVWFGFRSAVLLYTNDGFGMPLNLVKDEAQKIGQGGAIESIPIFGAVPWEPDVLTSIVEKVKKVYTRLLCVAARNDAIDSLLQLLVDNGLHAPQYQILSSAVLLVATKHHLELKGSHFIAGLADEEMSSFHEYEAMKGKMTRDDIEKHLEEYGITDWSPLPYFPHKMLTPEKFAQPGDMLTQGFSMILFSVINLVYKSFNELLWAGKSPDQIRGALLKQKLMAMAGEGIGTVLSFNANQDSMNRLVVLEIMRFTSSTGADGSTVYRPVNRRIVKGTPEHNINVDHEDPMWPDGTFSNMPPDEYVMCPLGTYKQTDGSCARCPRGQMSTALDTTECTKCDLGTVADATQTRCERCLAGTIAAERGLETCSQCPAGQYSDADGAYECLFCVAGEYSEDRGATSCKSCPGGLTTKEIGSKDVEACVCREGTFKGLDGSCTSCGEGLDCPVGALFANIPPKGSARRLANELPYPKVEVGYYTSYDDPTSVYACLEDSWCPGGPPESCSANAEGIACGTCLEGFFRNDEGSCEACSDVLKTRGLLLILPWLLVPFIFFMSQDESDVHLWYRAKYIKAPLAYVVLFFFQTFAAYSLVAVSLPSTSQKFSTGFSYTLDVRNVIRPECAEFHAFGDNFAAGLLAPLYFLVIVGASWLLSLGLGRMHSMLYRKWYILLSFFGACYSTFFLSIASLTFSLFACYPHPNGKSSLRKASHVLCFEGEWNGLVGVGVVGIFVFVALAMASMAGAIFVARRFYSKLIFRLSTKFLFIRYRVGFAYWSIVLLVKGLAVSLTVVLFTDAVSQFMWIDAVLLAYVPLVTLLHPWRSQIVNTADIISHVILVYVFALGGFFVAETPAEKEKVGNTATAFAIIACVVFFICILFNVQKIFVEVRRPTKLENDADDFAKEFCETLQAVGSDQAVAKHLYKMLPDYEQSLFREMQHILHREAGNKGGVRMMASSQELSVKVTTESLEGKQEQTCKVVIL